MHLPLYLFAADCTLSEINVCPSLAFSLRHSVTREYPRRDCQVATISVSQTADFSLEAEGGIPSETMSRIILSHLHFDRIGVTSVFPNATSVVGMGSEHLLKDGFPANPQSDILQNTLLDCTCFLADEDFNMSIGPFPRALDYFADGSLYLVDTIGHLAGHVNVLVRTSATGSWIYLAVDTAADAHRREAYCIHGRLEWPYALCACE
ncbi:uncharacterized protein LAESUDRAFT_811589 [Laetiporus sulphureus 93-53]|uniref:Uncharacterized protein n=1 Tax=Laetiporus sulphureus 93-53 TaxID=1314785 RepID=A0A165F099_9APHY|nr:uncharacterized protein LAESUDRAFT_811589 [Laetiporus sulphureus 93-53]KZT08093.1 hypothetical protein LAESUDRAFT_811589 [Laetiporus sulphureus 93-53]